jgi:hypothetical protein
VKGLRALALRRRIAVLGVFAVLFQALLFGWHHHPLPLSSHATQSVASTKGAAPLSPVSAEDDCDICAALHHVGASPVDFAAVPMPVATASSLPLPVVVLAARLAERAFQARAPPRSLSLSLSS